MIMDHNNQNKRIVQKRYGIKLVFATNGVAGRFSVFRTMIAVCAAFTYVAMIRLLTDFILMYCVQEKIKYYNQKYDHLYFDDEAQKWVLGNSLAMPDLEPPTVLF